ncbi:DUF6069 family protein [Pseudonocardia adelaidensis]|uniref:Uncharacterized protein n=1 Tax=Pseudonocardia adelaidensis TaxID=648754 RepID=A0ABP9NAW8_9PSEU
MNPAERRSEPRLVVDSGRLWSGGAATAVVVALVALVGVLIGDGALDLDMTEPPLLPVGGSFAVSYAITGAVLALAPTGLAHLLAVTAPRPRSFFARIVGLATVVAVVLPLTRGIRSPGESRPPSSTSSSGCASSASSRPSWRGRRGARGAAGAGVTRAPR